MTTLVVLAVVLVVAVIILLLPLMFRKKGAPLAGPDLSELEYTEVFFKSGDLDLAGMLFVPKGDGPFTAVVIIHGSGTSRRNSPWYLTVAKHLQERGIGVLLPDKRGSEKSEGDWMEATFYDLARDASGAIDLLREQTIVECSRIGVMGFSQGGWIAPIVAIENQSVAFVVSMSGAGVTTDEQLLWEVTNDIAGSTYRFIAKLVAPLIVSRIKKGKLWQAIGGFDPIPHWQKVDVPAFMAFGENDRNVPVEESVRRIQALNKRSITVKVYPKGGHGIIDPVSHRVQEEFLNDVADFIGRIETA